MDEFLIKYVVIGGGGKKLTKFSHLSKRRKQFVHWLAISWPEPLLDPLLKYFHRTMHPTFKCSVLVRDLVVVCDVLPEKLFANIFRHKLIKQMNKVLIFSRGRAKKRGKLPRPRF